MARGKRLAEHRLTLVGHHAVTVAWDGDEDKEMALTHSARERLVEALLGTQAQEQEEYLQDAKKIPAMLGDMNDALKQANWDFAKRRTDDAEAERNREQEVRKQKAQGAAERQEAAQ